MTLSFISDTNHTTSHKWQKIKKELLYHGRSWLNISSGWKGSRLNWHVTSHELQKITYMYFVCFPVTPEFPYYNNNSHIIVCTKCKYFTSYVFYVCHWFKILLVTFTEKGYFWKISWLGLYWNLICLWNNNLLLH